MSYMGTFELTHPELMSETELRTILKNRCIDFTKYEKLCRSDLIEVYKKIAMPLPQRTKNTDSNSDNKLQDQSSTVSKPSSLKRDCDEFSTQSEPTDPKKSKLHINQVKGTARNISSNEENCNGTEKRPSDESDDEASGKKRQMITWP